MFAAVILGYLVSTLLAFCGLVSVCCFLMDGAYTSKLEFATGLAVASWPLGLAAIVFLLVQIACQIEALKFRSMSAGTAPAQTNSSNNAFATQKQATPPSASGQFFRADPQPVISPVPAAAPTPAPKPDASDSGEDNWWEEPSTASEQKKESAPATEDPGLGFFRVN